MTGPRVLRPLSSGEIVNEAFDLYKRSAGLLASIGAVVYVPYALFLPYAVATGTFSRFPLFSTLSLLGFCTGLAAANGAMIEGLARRYLGQEVSAAALWRAMARRLIPYLITTAFQAVLMLASSLVWPLLVVAVLVKLGQPSLLPGLVMLFLLCFTSVGMFLRLLELGSIMVLERRYYTAAIVRRHRLGAGQRARHLGITLFLTALALAVLLAATVVASFVAALSLSLLGSSYETFNALWPGVVLGTCNAGELFVVAPMAMALSVVLYFDSRVRNEGFDLELLAEALGQVPAGPDVSPSP